jgi:hypothetical protein
MAITPLPPAPTRDDPANFSAKGDALMTQLPLFVTETNATAAAITAMAAGTAFSMPYTFDSTITDSDPTSGKLRLGSVVQNTSTVIRINLTGSDGVLNTATLNDFASSTNTIKGQIRLVKVGDQSKWLSFNVTSVASPTGYKNITVTPVNSTAASPFVSGDSLALLFTRAGDLGNTLPYAWFRDQKPNGTNGGQLTTAIFNTRTLNATIVNSLGASLTSNAINLPAGTYQVRATCPATQAVTVHQARLRNTTDNTTLIVGTSESRGNVDFTTRSIVQGQFTILAAKNIELQHYFVSGSSAQHGGMAATSGEVEVYSEIELWKVA